MPADGSGTLAAVVLLTGAIVAGSPTTALAEATSRPSGPPGIRAAGASLPAGITSTVAPGVAVPGRRPGTHLHGLIDQAARRHGVEVALVHAVIAAESAYNPRAVSPAGAIGLMQVMPPTAADYGVEDARALFDPTVNVDTGVRHLKRLLTKYGNDYGRAIMAYNAGEGVVDRTNSNVRFTETLNYTEAVIRKYRRLGGTQPTVVVMERVAALRAGRPAPSFRSKRRISSSQSSPAPSGILPKSSPSLDNRLAQAPLDDVSPLTSRRAGTARAGNKPATALRPGRDPVIRPSSSGRDAALRPFPVR